MSFPNCEMCDGSPIGHSTAQILHDTRGKKFFLVTTPLSAVHPVTGHTGYFQVTSLVRAKNDTDGGFPEYPLSDSQSPEIL